jgi:hypothetical protein
VAPQDDIRTISRRRFLQGAAMGAAAAALGPAGLAEAAGNPLAAASNRDVLVFEGVLSDASGGMIHLDVEGGVVGAAISPASSFWRGTNIDISGLRAGDNVMMRVRAGHVERAWANLSRIRGIVTGRSGGVYAVSGGYGYGPVSDFALHLSGWTSFIDATTGDTKHLTGLVTGTTVDAIGLMVDGMLRATILTYLEPGVRLPRRTDEPASIERVTLNTPSGPYNVCNTTYYGTATWFRCYSSLAKCQYCHSASGGACAWPYVIPPPGGVCDSTSGCENESQAWCGKDIEVDDRCSSTSLPCAVVDCGPCQNSNCSPPSINVCGYVCSDCANGVTPVVDLTHDSFSLFYDPATHGCFSCKVVNTINC